MMIAMSLPNLTNAIKNAKKRRAKVRRIDDETFEVQCSKGHKHIVRFMFDGETLWATCDCPSRVACYHLIHAHDLYEALTLQAEAAEKLVQSTTGVSSPAAEALSRNARMDNAMLASAPHRPAERCGGIRV